MTIQNFTTWLAEGNLKPGSVFKTKDTTGDLADVLLFVKSSDGEELTVLLPDGTESVTTAKMLNVDTKSIRAYDPKKDPAAFKKK